MAEAQAKVMVQDATPKKVMALASRKYSRDDKIKKDEEELEQLIEKNCFIDLFTIVNSSLLIGASSYSLKTVEKLAGINRTEDLQSGMESIQYFEDYFFNEEYELKDLIIEYNKADCKNLYLLHDWLASLL